MTLETRNIIIGASRFFVSVADSTGTLPARPVLTGTTALAPVTTDWRDVGFTTDGVEVSYEPDYGDVEVDQLLDSAVIYKQGMRVTVNTTLMEATLENLLVIWGQTRPVAVGTDVTEVSISAGNLGDFPLERSLLFVGPSPRTPAAVSGAVPAGSVRRERVYHISRAVQTESSSMALRRAEATSLPASFRCLPNPNATGGPAYGTVADRTITT